MKRYLITEDKANGKFVNYEFNKGKHNLCKKAEDALWFKNKKAANKFAKDISSSLNKNFIVDEIEISISHV